MEKIYKGAEFMEYPKEKRVYNLSVKAIPVEWMKHWAMKNWAKSKKCEYDIIVSKMLDDWEEEKWKK